MWNWLTTTVAKITGAYKPPAPKGAAPLKVGYNTGFQGSSYNPQKTAPSPQQTWSPQKTAPTNYHQGSSYNPQPAIGGTASYAVQAAQRAAQAQAAQRAAAAEAARQEAIRIEKIRVQKTNEHNNRLTVNRAKVQANLTVARAKQYFMAFAGRNGHWSEYFTADGKLVGGDKYDEKTAPTRIKNAHAQLQKALSFDGEVEEGDLDELAKAVKSKYRLTANQLIEQRKKGGIWDQVEGRKGAQKSQADIQNKWGVYEKRVKNFKSNEASWSQKILSAKNKGDINGAQKAYQDYVNWRKKELRVIVYYGAALEGLSEGYGKQADQSYKGGIGNIFNGLNSAGKAVGSGAGTLFNHTLGQGNKDVPSLVTVGTRAINLVRNALGNSGKTLNYHDSMQTEAVSHGNLLDRWRQTFQQRAGNMIHPDNVVGGNVGTKPKGLSDKEWQLHQALLKNKGTNYLGEFGLDMVGSLGTAAVGRTAAKATGKGFKATTKAIGKSKTWQELNQGWTGKAIEGMKWLGKEHKPLAVQMADARALYSKTRAAAQAKYWPQYQKLMGQIKGSGVDYKVVDDLGKLTDKEAAILQRMKGLDKFSARDNFFLRADPVKRQKLLDIHQRWQGIAANMKLADDVGSTRFAGKYYSHGWQPSATKDVYNFRKFKKGKHTLKAADLHAAQIERLFMSNLDETGPLVKGTNKLRDKAKKTWQAYDDELIGARDTVESLYKKRKLKRDLPGKILGLPQNVWKASTLATRPAWYANNIGSNELLGALSGGPRFFLEQAKLLRKGALTKARLANPDVGSKISQYHGGNWLYKAATSIEDNARHAAFNANKKKGLSDAAALKRTDDYLIDYTTKNWERPVKTLLPFWGWTKGINKATARMPFDRPGAANVLNSYDEKTQRELGKLPADQRKFYQSGSYVGKDGKGNPRFLNMPWLPFTSSNSKNVGINPYIAAGDELYKNKDYYGNPLENKGFFATLASKFPQYKLADDIKRSGFTDVKYLAERGSEGFGLTKKQTVDRNERGLKTLKSYMGWNDTRSFDWERSHKLKNDRAFMDEWFKRDWDKEFAKEKFADSNAAYEAKTAAQKAVAGKYGLDLDKDVYHGLFSKNDTENTKHIKMLKDQAAKYGDEFWAEYKKQPLGTRSRWAAQKMKEVEASGRLARNAYIEPRLPQWHSAENAIKYGGPAKVKTAVQYNGKWFKNAASRDKYIAGQSRYARKQAYDKAKATGDWSYFNKSSKGQSPHQADGKFFKSAESMKKYQEGKFWKDYYATTDFTKRQALLTANPQYKNNDFKLPTTDAEWDVYKSEKKKKQRLALSGVPSWMAAYEKHKASTPVRVKFKASKKIVWKG